MTWLLLTLSCIILWGITDILLKNPWIIPIHYRNIRPLFGSEL